MFKYTYVAVLSVRSNTLVIFTKFIVFIKAIKKKLIFVIVISV